MRTFLQDVAHDLFIKTNGDFSKTAIVFPNKRAGLFFNEYLTQEGNKPMWAPQYVSIKDLIQNLSPLKLGDPILLVSVLYNIYIEQTGSEETLDSFYPWGQLLISDFDDVDKNLVDADRIFENLRDLKNEMNDLDFLDEEQERALQQFFENFSIEKQTELKKRFTTSWNRLKDIYHSYKDKLTEMGIAYEGMLYRSVIDKITSLDLPYDHYVFVGFNVLNKVEQRFFSIIKDAGKAMFYWDYDEYYTRLTDKICQFEAGEFIRVNLATFGNELDESYFHHLDSEKHIRYIAASSENAQARYMSQWAESLADSGPEKENAVVLCNESLLLPVLHSIPDKVKNVNVTMGFPLSQTPIYNFVKATSDLQTEGFNAETGQFDYQYIRLLLSHPYTQKMSDKAAGLLNNLTIQNHPYSYPSELAQDDFLTILFTPQNGNLSICQYLINLIQKIASIYRTKQEKSDLYTQLYQESLYQSFVTINRLMSLIQENQINISSHTLNRLLASIMHGASIPFHGEPAIGMQIMGVLETRNLDFKNLLMLSLNEGQLPKAGSEMSFIPYNLRKAFGMTTIEHKNAVFAYYFYRLIQRAENITLLYNSTTSGLSKGEMSRFMLQLLIEYPFHIERKSLEAKQSPALIDALEVTKTKTVMQMLLHRFDTNANSKVVLSPSALNQYMDCTLRFFFRYVAGIKVPDEATVEINSPMFGTIFHKSAEMAYKAIADDKHLVTSSSIEAFLKDPILLKQIIDNAFKTEFFNLDIKEKAQYNGTHLINFKVMETYMKQLLNFDKRFAPFSIVYEEKRVSLPMHISTPEGDINLNIGGSIDRMDEKEGTLRIVDYKTGGEPKTLCHISDLFDKEANRANYIFQAFLYASIIKSENSHRAVKPTLLYIHKSANENYSSDILMGEPRQPKEAIEDVTPHIAEFNNELNQLVQEIFNPEIPFKQVEDEGRCEFCDFAKICKR